MIYEIVNPSDAVTIEADDELIAGVATLIVGRGAYGLQREDHTDAMPLFLFAKQEDVDRWIASKGGTDMETVLRDRQEEIAACLLSARVCDIRERRDLRPLAEDEVDAFNDKRRSSLNDIAGYARSVGRHLRRKGEGG